MEIKKSPKADLEGRKLLYREVGLIIALLLVLAAFEWSTAEKTVSTFQEETAVVAEEEIIPITQEETPPPPEAPKEPVLSDFIDIVDDDIQVDTELLISVEDDADMGVEIRNYVPQGTTEEEEEEEEIPVAIVDEKPKFMGGDQSEFTAWVSKNIVYPEIAKESRYAAHTVFATLDSIAVAMFYHTGTRQIIDQSGSYTYGAASGTAPTVRGRESLV